MPINEQELAEQFKKTLATVNEVLKKSGYNDLQKDGEAEPDAMEGQADEAMEQEGGEAEGDAGEGGDPSLTGESEGPEMGAEGEQGAGDDEAAQMMEHLQSMPDEELHMMMELIQNELGEREAAAQGGEAGGEMEGGADEGQQQLQMSMKQEFAGLAKSISEMAQAVSALTKSQTAMQTEISTLKKSEQKAKTQAKPAAQNRQVQVLEKSAQAAPVEKLSKSGIENFLMNELRKSSSQRNPAVTRELLADLTYIKTDSQIKEFAGKLREMGIQLPS